MVYNIIVEEITKSIGVVSFKRLFADSLLKGYLAITKTKNTFRSPKSVFVILFFTVVMV